VSTPTRFHVESFPQNNYLVFPRHSSERRIIIRLGDANPAFLTADACLTSHEAKPCNFGVLSSTRHNAWVRHTCGRLKSDFRYSKDIVYNNFPWPESLTDAQRAMVKAAAQAVPDARAAFPNSSLADLYDRLTMPSTLLKAQQTLDAGVDAAYGKKASRATPSALRSCSSCIKVTTALLPADKTMKRSRSARARV
jgi:hypothetical protein